MTDKSTNPNEAANSQLARPTTGGSVSKRKAKKAEEFNSVDLKAKATSKTSVDAVGGDRNLTAAMVEVADKQFQHAARAYGDRCSQNMAELEKFVQQCQGHMYDGITLNLAQQFGYPDTEA